LIVFFYSDCFKFRGEDFKGVCHEIDTVGDVRLLIWMQAKGRPNAKKQIEGFEALRIKKLQG